MGDQLLGVDEAAVDASNAGGPGIAIPVDETEIDLQSSYL